MVMGDGPGRGWGGKADRMRFKQGSEAEANRLCWKVGRQKNSKNCGCRATWVMLVFTAREKPEGREMEEEIEGSLLDILT